MLEHVVETGVAGLGGGAVAVDPVGQLPQHLGFEVDGAPLCVAPAGDQAGGLEDREVFAHGLQGHVVGGGELADGGEDFDAQRAFTPWTSTWNMLGTAALSVPLHREAVDGVELPFGVQLGATRPGDEPLLLALAAQLEAHDPWPLVRTPHAA